MGLLVTDWYNVQKSTEKIVHIQPQLMCKAVLANINYNDNASCDAIGNDSGVIFS